MLLQFLSLPASEKILDPSLEKENGRGKTYRSALSYREQLQQGFGISVYHIIESLNNKDLPAAGYRVSNLRKPHDFSRGIFEM